MIMFYEGKVGRVRRARAEDVEPIGWNLRQSDVAELHDGVGVAPIPALLRSYRASSSAWTIAIGDEPVAMFGVAPDPDLYGFGHVWYLATARWDREGRRDMVVASRLFVDAMLDGFDLIGNFVDRRNPTSIKWLKHLGFTEGNDWIGTASGLPFVFMFKAAPHV